MKVIDVIFALICGKVVGFVVSDFLRELGINPTISQDIFIWLAFPLFALLCLWVANAIGRKFLFVFQGTKHLLIGAFATVIDLKLFESILWVFSFFLFVNPLLAKAISFIFSTAVKYWGNKYWAFQKHEKEHIGKEAFHFFLITIIGLTIDITAFYYATHVLGPQFSLPPAIWTKFSVIFAAIVATLWNFLGYKFIVFKK